ncbi:hypothetical protein BT96DRAFT_1015135 [Gymnopus androsaceus JB14]|uniref:Uncharacterized protein n=1 Tax=Gymnopus androsaceus JB14 TaxID=1447944 RepID=A0A6A4I6K7_9AGAR|nr:hypothetical protein BT96DRAFT_1015135 [Gymnopus androsaceus JB14]
MPEISKTKNAPSIVLFASLRRVFHSLSCGATMPEMEFISKCKYVSTLLEDTNFQDLIESVQTLFLDIVEMAVIVFISRAFPAARFSILPLVDFIPESHEAVSALFDLIDVQVSQHCSYGPQLRMAAIDQLLRSNAATVTFDSSVITQKSSATPSDSQELLNSHAPSSKASSSVVSSGQLNSSSLPTWSTPKCTTDSFTFLNDSRESFDSNQLTDTAGDCELPLVLCGFNTQTPARSPELRKTPSTSSINLSTPDSALSPIPQASLGSDSVFDNASNSDIAHASTEIQSLPVSFPSLQVHDHSRKSSIDLASVPSELLTPCVTRNHAGFSLQSPIPSLPSSELDVLFTRLVSTGSLDTKTDGKSYSRAEGEDAPSSLAPVDAREERVGTGDTPSADTRGTLSTHLSVPVFGDELEVKELGKGKRKRQSRGRSVSLAGMRKTSAAESPGTGVGPDSPRYDADHPRRSKRQRTVSVQNSAISPGAEIGLGLPKGDASPTRRVVSRMNKENRDTC